MNGNGFRAMQGHHHEHQHHDHKMALNQKKQADHSFDFQSFDENKDGILSRDEFSKAQKAQAHMHSISQRKFAEFAYGDAHSHIPTSVTADPPVEPLKKSPVRHVYHKKKDDD